MIEFHLNNGQVFYIIDKPTNFIADLAESTFGIGDEGSKTIRLLKEKCPELEEKIREREFTQT